MSKNLIYTSSQAGFSLLEMTIVLSILGILSSFALPVISEYRHHRAFRMTQDHQERIVKSLDSYLVHHKYLPKPDDYPKGHLEKSTKDSPSTSRHNSKNLIGVVPRYALGLPETVIKDGYGNFITYVVAHDACEPVSLNHMRYFCNPQGINSIKIRDEKNKSVLSSHKRVIKNLAQNEPRRHPIRYHEDNFYDDEAENYIAFVLISHGPEGPMRAGSPEEENNNQVHANPSKIILFARPYSINPTALFRHQLVWGTQQEFAGFCKSEKIIKAFDRFNQTFTELEKFADTMEQSSDIFTKLEKLILKAKNEPFDQKKSLKPLKIKNTDDSSNGNIAPSKVQEEPGILNAPLPSGKNFLRVPLNNPQKKIQQPIQKEQEFKDPSIPDIGNAENYDSHSF